MLADEERGVGHVSSAVYMAYAKAVGPFLVVVVLASLTLMQVNMVIPQAVCAPDWRPFRS